jgi:hypothetical protein
LAASELVRIVTLTSRRRKSPNACTPIVPGTKYGDDSMTSLRAAITRSITPIVTLMLRASSSVFAVTLSGESANAVARPQCRPSWPPSRSSRIGP